MGGWCRCHGEDIPSLVMLNNGLMLTLHTAARMWEILQSWWWCCCCRFDVGGSRAEGKLFALNRFRTGLLLLALLLLLLVLLPAAAAGVPARARLPGTHLHLSAL